MCLLFAKWSKCFSSHNCLNFISEYSFSCTYWRYSILTFISFLYTTIHHFCKLFWLAASSGCFSKLLFYDDCKSSRGFKSQWKKVNSLGIAALQLGYREESVWLAKEKLWLGKTHVRPLLKFCRTFWLVSTKSRSCQQSVTILALQAAKQVSGTAVLLIVFGYICSFRLLLEEEKH